MSEHITSRRTLLGGALSATTLGAMVTAAAPAEASVPTQPASDFFLLINGIKGDSTNAAHAKTIEVLDWTFGVETLISPTNTGSGASKSKPKDFTFVARTSIASPALFLAAAKGTHFTAATLFARRIGVEQPYDYLTIKLENLFVTSYVVAPDSVDAFPTDVVHMDYGKLTMTYKPQLPTGQIGTPVTAGFDFINNVAL